MRHRVIPRGFYVVAWLLHWMPFALAAGEDGPKELAIIVHPDNEVAEMSFTELQRVFRLTKTRWNNGGRIYLLMQEEGSPEKDLILRRVYHMTSDELKRFWLAKIYRGEMTSFPTTLRSNLSVRRFVSRVPHAIGYIDAHYADESVKILRIDGKRPGEEGYVLGETIP